MTGLRRRAETGGTSLFVFRRLSFYFVVIVEAVRHCGALPEGRRGALLAGASPVRDVGCDEIDPGSGSAQMVSHPLRQGLYRHSAQPVRGWLDGRIRQPEQTPENLGVHAD